MKTMAAEEFKSNFPEVLKKVKKGQKVGILYGRAKKPVAMIVPYQEEKRTERKIGILDGKVTIKFSNDFKMTTEELCAL